MKDLISIDDIARELKVSHRTIQRLAANGSLPAITITRRGGFTYVVPLQSYFNWKTSYKKKKEEHKHLADFNVIKEEQSKWSEWSRNGLLTGKPQCEKTIELNNYFLNYYWRHLPRRYKNTSLISVNYLRYVLGNIDPKSFSLKDNIYKAIRSFIKYLIANNYSASSLLDELKQLKPKRLYPLKKVHCTQEQFETLLKEAGKWKSGQSAYDVVLNYTLIATLGFTGLRASELCNLKLLDVDLVNKKIFVYLGKGKKNRYVGICNRLYDYLVNYLKLRPRTNLENFFVTTVRLSNEPVPFTPATLLRKVKRLSRRIGIEVNVHGLRRTFATVAANSGKPINIISLALGHTDLKTTQGYLMTTQDEVVRQMQGW